MSIEAFHFQLVPADDIDPDIHGKASRVLGFCSRILGLSGVQIQWVKPMTRTNMNIADSISKIQRICAEILGECWPGFSYETLKQGEFYGAVFPLRTKKLIYIRADIGLRLICRAIAHECKHMSEFGPGAPGPIPVTPEDDAASEARAKRFAEEAMLMLGIL